MRAQFAAAIGQRRGGRRPAIGLLACTAVAVLLALSTAGYAAPAQSSIAATLGRTNAQAGYLHPASYTAPPQGVTGPAISCGIPNPRCLDLEVYASEAAYGRYVGHDEPSLEFLSTTPGSGNQFRSLFQIPKDPPTQPTRANGVSWTFMQSVAPWFGMAMCNDYSYPEVHRTAGSCVPDSDANIADNLNPAATDYIGNHVGGAYMEFQFYPPGWAPQFPNETTGGVSCDGTLWCSAMVIWSFQSAADGTNNNTVCQKANGGVEYGNFAYLTHSGHASTPANPLNPNAFFPNSNFVMYMHSGDYMLITMHDVPDSSPGPMGSGLEVDLQDLTTGESGAMVASGAGANNNGFAGLQWDPTGKACTAVPYNFHPMYSTSGLHTRVPWAAHTYNVAWTDEIGHFDYCDGTLNQFHSGVTKVNNPTGGCGGNEGPPADSEPAEAAGTGNAGGDDSVCYDGTLPISTSLVHLPGCLGSNLPGFDGTSYLDTSTLPNGNSSSTWPDGNFNMRPYPFRFSSLLTGANYDQNYSDVAFESDLPALEFVSGPGQLAGTASTCSIATGAGCTAQPPTDDTAPGPPQFGFYPFFSMDNRDPNHCWWMLGQDITLQAGNNLMSTTNDFNGGMADTQYGLTGAFAFPYNVGFLQGVVRGLPPITAPLVEDFHTLSPSNTDAFGPYSIPNPCPAVSLSGYGTVPQPQASPSPAQISMPNTGVITRLPILPPLALLAALALAGSALAMALTRSRRA